MRIKDFISVVIMSGLFLRGPADAAVQIITIDDFYFSPASVQIAVGDTVTWINEGVYLHSTTSDNAIWDSGSLSHGGTFSFVFNEGGAYSYHCSIHPFMLGTVYVEGSGIGDEPARPAQISLAQNYPNPFNNRTLISFDLSVPTHVTLGIYDIRGQKIATILDEECPAGRHEVAWDATGLSSGIYFYRILAGATSDIKKMVLLK